MEKTSVQKLAQVVRVLILVVFACNIIALLLVPGLACLTVGGFEAFHRAFDAAFSGGEGLYWVIMCFINAWWAIWIGGVVHVVVTLFLWVCGMCTAIILWQAKSVLTNIIGGRVFFDENGDHLKVAAMCCFVISAAALAYEIFGLWLYQGEIVLLTFGFMLIFVFLIAGLICLVMSALFWQAAEMKAENDLTI